MLGQRKPLSICPKFCTLCKISNKRNNRFQCIQNVAYIHDFSLAWGKRRSGTFQGCQVIGLVCLAGERMRILSGGTNPQEGWPMSGETQQSLGKENIKVRGKQGNLLARKEQGRACKLNRGTGPTKKTLGWRAKSTKTCMNVQGWNKKSLKSSFWDVFSYLKWGWQALCSVVHLWVLPCKKGPCPTRALCPCKPGSASLNFSITSWSGPRLIIVFSCSRFLECPSLWPSFSSIICESK